MPVLRTIIGGRSGEHRGSDRGTKPRVAGAVRAGGRAREERASPASRQTRSAGAGISQRVLSLVPPAGSEPSAPPPAAPRQAVLPVPGWVRWGAVLLFLLGVAAIVLATLLEITEQLVELTHAPARWAAP